MRRESKKIFKGNVEIKDYDVHNCILKKENFEIEHEGNIMTLTPEELITKRVTISHMFKTKQLGGKNYKLFGYPWIPDIIEL